MPTEWSHAAVIELVTHEELVTHDHWSITKCKDGDTEARKM